MRETQGARLIKHVRKKKKVKPPVRKSRKELVKGSSQTVPSTHWFFTIGLGN